VQIRDVLSLRFSDSCQTPVRVIRVRETWIQREQKGPECFQHQKEQNWMWVVAGELHGYVGAVIRDIGQSCWKIENHAFGQVDRPAKEQSTGPGSQSKPRSEIAVELVP
jgi:hypothetical protein